LELTLTTSAVNDLDFWKEIAAYDREAIIAAAVLENTAKKLKKKKAKGRAKSKGFGK
jgi:hypothetical protein